LRSTWLLCVLSVNQPVDGAFDCLDLCPWPAEYFVEVLVGVPGYVDDVVPEGVEEFLA
jgi:hypothetical protein